MCEYEKRLLRDDKANIDYAKFGAENSIAQQKVYLQMANEIKESYPSIKTLEINNVDLEKTQNQLRDFLKY